MQTSAVIDPLAHFLNNEVLVEFDLLEVGTERSQLKLKVGHRVGKLSVFNHERTHFVCEAFDPNEKLVRVVYRSWNLLQRLDQTHDIGATTLSDLTAREGGDPFESLCHDSCLARPCWRFLLKQVVH